VTACTEAEEFLAKVEARGRCDAEFWLMVAGRGHGDHRPALLEAYARGAGGEGPVVAAYRRGLGL